MKTSGGREFFEVASPELGSQGRRSLRKQLRLRKQKRGRAELLLVLNPELLLLVNQGLDQTEASPDKVIPHNVTARNRLTLLIGPGLLNLSLLILSRRILSQRSLGLLIPVA
jgi:hypothetical protein